MRLLIKNGRVLDPATDRDKIMDVLVENDLVVKCEENISEPADSIIDATGCYVCPGLIDLGAQLREPGFEHKETIRTGCAAAAKGGYTTICPMPDTKPCIDNVDTFNEVCDKAKDVAKINVMPMVAATAAQYGEFLIDMARLKEAGAVAVCEGEKSVKDARVFRQAMRLAANIDLPIFSYCEDKDLTARGVINAGDKAKELGVYGIMNAAEDTIVARDILLSRNTGAKLHICHCSTEDSTWMVKSAKEHKLTVTADVCPHHFALSDEDIPGDDARFKVNPPLRSRSDVNAVVEGIRGGVFDVISSGHTPHNSVEKAKSIKDAPFGISSFETTLSVTITELVDKGIITPMQMVEMMSYHPARIINVDRGTLADGSIADITVVDPNAEWTVVGEEFVSMGKHTPFEGRKLKGKVKYTIVAGEVAYKAE